LYFLRLAIPLAAIVAKPDRSEHGLLVELVLQLVFRVPLGLQLLAIPVLVALIILTALAVLRKTGLHEYVGLRRRAWPPW
jgi:hypothetical protein